MKVLKRSSALCLLILMMASMFTFSAGAKAEVQNVEVNLYSNKLVKIDVPTSLKGLDFTVKTNSKSLGVDLLDESGETGPALKAKNRFFVEIAAFKKADKVQTVTLKYAKNGKSHLYRKFKVSVNDMKKVNFKDVTINKGSVNKVKIPNPYCDYYTFKVSDKSKLYIEGDAYYYGKYKYNGLVRAEDNFAYCFTAKKTGSVKVDVYITNANKKVGSFNVTIGDYKTYVYEDNKVVKLKYSKYGSNAYMSESHILIEDILNNSKSNAKYKVVSDNEKAVSFLGSGHLYAEGIGTANCSVYEKIGKTTTLVDKITVKVKKAPMSYVARENYYWYDDGIFGKGEYVEYLNLTDNTTLEMEDTIKTCLINNKTTGSHFKPSQYSISYKSDNPKVATVTKKGTVTAKSLGYTNITYSIKFSDKSVYKGNCQVSVEPEW
ncbi:MAG: Ig-like domain-containing protein [Ruminococcus sp.]